MDNGIWIRDCWQDIQDLLKRYSVPEEHFIVVPSIPNWCREHGIKDSVSETNIALVTPPRVDTGDRYIVFREFVPHNVIETQLKPAVMMRNLDEDVGKLDTDRIFIFHTLLHEIAHKNGMKKEYDANRWAFRQMEKLGLIRGKA